MLIWCFCFFTEWNEALIFSLFTNMFSARQNFKPKNFSSVKTVLPFVTLIWFGSVQFKMLTLWSAYCVCYLEQDCKLKMTQTNKVCCCCFAYSREFMLFIPANGSLFHHHLRGEVNLARFLSTTYLLYEKKKKKLVV